MAHQEGFRVGELPVRHRVRKFGKTKYGMARFMNGFLDLLTVFFLHARGRSPLHFFGRVGMVFFFLGMIINGYFLVDWLVGNPLHIRPLMVIGFVFVIMAIQFVSLGLLAELVVAGRQPETEYRVRRRL
jgi:hypothetical protein